MEYEKMTNHQCWRHLTRCARNVTDCFGCFLKTASELFINDDFFKEMNHQFQHLLLLNIFLVQELSQSLFSWKTKFHIFCTTFQTLDPQVVVEVESIPAPLNVGQKHFPSWHIGNRNRVGRINWRDEAIYVLYMCTTHHDRIL